MNSIAALQKRHDKIERSLSRKAAEAKGIRLTIAIMQAKIRRLQARLEGIEGEVSASGAPPAMAAATKAPKAKRPRRKLPRNKTPQKPLVMEILKSAGKALRLDDIVAAMRKRGYKFASREPAQSIGVLVYSDKKTFKVAKPGFIGLR